MFTKPFAAFSAIGFVTVGLVSLGVSQDKAVGKGDATGSTKKSVIAVFSLDGPIVEKPRAEDFPLGSMNTESLKDLVERMDKAAKDDDVRAAVVLLGNTGFGSGQVEELRRAMQRLRQAGKDVYAHADSLAMSSYVLLSGASKLSVAPNGDLFINGLYGEGLYVRGLLNKLGVQPDYVTCGEYKSAAEMFMREGPSRQAKEMHDWMFDSLYDSYLDMIADGRGVARGKVEQWVQNGLYTAEAAAQEGIIDAAEYRAEFVRRLKEKYGDGLAFSKSYKKKKGPNIDLSNPFAAFQIWGDLFFGTRGRRSTKDAIVIVYVDGPIMPGKAEVSPFGSMQGAYSDPIRRALDKAAEDDSVKAVVLRVDSPGGSAVASEIIMQATKRVKEKKPIVVSMGNVAGSGGYYVACGADTIFADATTITGSIGVVAGKLATSQMWNKVGINWDPIKRGKNSDMLSSSQVFTDQQREKLLSWMHEVYDVFKGHVTKVRGDRLAKPIDQLAGGRVFTGKQAKELGLVDQIGGMNEAIQFVAEQANIEDFELRVIPRAKNFMELLMADLSSEKDDDDDPSTLSIDLSPRKSAGQLLETVLPMLNGVDPARADAVRQALVQLEMLQQERVLMSMPVIQIWN